MNDTHQNESLGGKIHPASREILPDDPMEMTGFQVPGDPQLMLRLLVEEYSRIGWDTQAIMRLARDPNYRGFHGLLQLYGEDALRDQVAEILSRTGVIRTTNYEKAPERIDLVQLNAKFSK